MDILKLIETYEKILPEKKKCYGLGAGIHLKNFMNSITFRPLDKIEGWAELFFLVKKSKHLLNASWCHLLWLVDYDNALKVFMGTFDDFDKESSSLNKDAILEAIKSGALSFSTLDAKIKKKLTQLEIDWISEKGGLKSLGQTMTEAQLIKLLGAS